MMATEEYSILVLGDAEVGKTSIINRFVDNSFSEHHAINSRDDVFNHKKMVQVDDRTSIIDIIDMPLDMEDIREAFPGCHGIVLVYSVLSMSSFRKMHEMHEAIHGACDRLLIPTPDMCIVGNMSDCGDGQEVNLADALNFMKKLSRSSCELCIHYYGVSAKTGHNVEKIFSNLVCYIRSSRAAREMEDSTKCFPIVEAKSKVPPKRPRISQLLLPGYWFALLSGTQSASTKTEWIEQSLIQNDLSKPRDGSRLSARKSSSWLYNGLLKCTWILIKFLIYTFIYSGMVLPPLKSEKTRMHWGCACGKTFYCDVPSSDWKTVVAASQNGRIDEREGQRRTGFESEEPQDSPPGSPESLRPSSEPVTEKQEIPNSSHPDLNSHEGEFSTNSSMSWNSNDVHHGSKTGGLRSRRVRAKEIENMDKWLLACLPRKSTGNDPGTIEHMHAKTKKDDKSMIQEVKELYESRTSRWTQLRHLRGFKDVRLIKFRLLRSQISDIWAAENDWTWPNQTLGWECPTQEIPVEIFDQQMLHYWKSPGPRHQATSCAKATRKQRWGIYKTSNLPLREQDLKEQPSSFSRILNILVYSLSPSFMPPENTSTKRHSIFRPLRSLGRAFTTTPTTLSQASTLDTDPPLEVDLSPSQYWLFHSLPKKIEEKLTWPLDCYQPPPGWGICVEEDFAIPWYVFVLLLVVPVGSMCFAIGWWVAHGPTMFDVAGVAIGGMSFVFAVWIAVVRDGKR